MKELRYSVFSLRMASRTRPSWRPSYPRRAKPLCPYTDKRCSLRGAPRGRGILPAMGWIVAALCFFVAVGAMVARIRGGVILNPFDHPDDTDTSTEGTGDGSSTEETEPLSFVVWDGSVATGFARGTGTPSAPYIIETPAQLAYLAKSLPTNEALATLSDCKLARIDISVDCTGAVTVYQGGVVGRILVGEKGGFMGERLQAVDVTLYSMNGSDLFQGILAGYTECHTRFELRDVCLEGVMGKGYISGQRYFAAVSGAFNNHGGRAVCKNVFAVCNNPQGSGHIFTYQVYVDKSAEQSFSFENCFMGHTTRSGSNVGNDDFLYYALEEYVTYRNCAYTISLPDENGFSGSVWDVSAPAHPRLK